MKKIIGIVVLVLATTSCETFDSDRLEQIGSRVVKLEDMVLDFNNQLEQLQLIVNTINEHGYITSITDNADGSYTLQMSTGKSITLKNGLKGQDNMSAMLDLNVKKDTDNNWYWTLDGDWLLTEDGNKMRVNGKDGKDDINLTLEVPKVRVNGTTQNWELSTDGGVTWEDMGVKAVGKDGKNDLFYSCIISSDGTKVTITLTDGRTFTIPIIPG